MRNRRLDALVIKTIPSGVRTRLRAAQKRLRLQSTPVGTVDLGSWNRLTPISGVFGRDRGLPIDRYYIEQFLAANASDIQGRVLEIGDAFYTTKFGGDRVTHSDVLHVRAGNPLATIVADLTRADNIPTDTFDCIILTQTLQMIYPLRAALAHVQRILKPGGVLLVTGSGITKIARREGIDDWGEYWHITGQGAQHLLQEFFPAANVHVQIYGNVLTAAANLYGMAAEEFTSDALDYCDADYEVLVTIRAQKEPHVPTPRPIP
jgi:SAM-dependent methyltransferase